MAWQSFTSSAKTSCLLPFGSSHDHLEDHVSSLITADECALLHFSDRPAVCEQKKPLPPIDGVTKA